MPGIVGRSVPSRRRGGLYLPAMSSTLAVLLLVAPQGPATVPEPNADNLREWMTFVQPAEHEEIYRTVGWRNALWPAVVEARELGRPILFWTMNGHPLGCT